MVVNCDLCKAMISRGSSSNLAWALLISFCAASPSKSYCLTRISHLEQLTRARDLGIDDVTSDAKVPPATILPEGGQTSSVRQEGLRGK